MKRTLGRGPRILRRNRGRGKHGAKSAQARRSECIPMIDLIESVFIKGVTSCDIISLVLGKSKNVPVPSQAEFESTQIRSA